MAKTEGNLLQLLEAAKGGAIIALSDQQLGNIEVPPLLSELHIQANLYLLDSTQVDGIISFFRDYRAASSLQKANFFRGVQEVEKNVVNALKGSVSAALASGRQVIGGLDS